MLTDPRSLSPLVQLDIEMAFTPKERIMDLAEELMVAAFQAREEMIRRHM